MTVPSLAEPREALQALVEFFRSEPVSPTWGTYRLHDLMRQAEAALAAHPVPAGLTEERIDDLISELQESAIEAHRVMTPYTHERWVKAKLAIEKSALRG